MPKFSPALVDAQAEVLEACVAMGCPAKLVAEKHKRKVLELLIGGMLPIDVAHEVYSIAAKEAYAAKFSK